MPFQEENSEGNRFAYKNPETGDVVTGADSYEALRKTLEKDGQYISGFVDKDGNFQEVILASRWGRLLASFIDLFLLFFSGLILLLVLNFSGINYPREDWFYNSAALPMAVIQAILLTWKGQTIGKKIFRFRVTGAYSVLNCGFFTNVIFRNSVNIFINISIAKYQDIYFCTFFTFLVLGIDFLFVFRKDRRSLHDLIAKTRVIKV